MLIVLWLTTFAIAGISKEIFMMNLLKKDKYLKYILKSKQKNIHDCLRRNGIRLQ